MLNGAAADAAGIDAYLARFVPNHRRQLLRGRRVGEPAARTLTAAVLYVDIVGFTSLTGLMTQHLAVGAEKMAEDVNRVLTGIAAIAERHGGEVMHFAGDAAWIGWFLDDPAELPAACHRAAAAAVAVHDVARSWVVGGRPVQLRASLGAGELHQLELGGERDRWCGLLRGPAIADAVAADHFGSAGSIIASPLVWQQVKKVGVATRLPDGYARIETVDAIETVAPSPLIEFVDGSDGAAVPEMIAHRAADGEVDRWSGEFRTCHVVFGRLQIAETDAGAAELHRAVAEIQRVLARTNGSLYQLLSDEKGLALIAAYGLPPHAGKTDGAHAIEAAVVLHETLGSLSIRAHFGVAVGRTFCTTYGADNQLQFALVGPALNRAARLADSAEAVTADKAIADAGLPAALAALDLPLRTLKGFADPVALSAIARRHSQQTDSATRNVVTLVGRTDELAHGVGRLTALREGRGGLLLIEGDPGAGKSMFAAALLEAAASRSLPTARGGTDEIERATEYRPWRQALPMLLAWAIDGEGRLSEAALGSLGPNRTYAGLLSRLIDVVPARDGADDRFTDEARAALLRQMAVDLLAARSRQGPFVLLLEDLHWFDSPSLALLDSLLAAGLPILVVATTRGDDRAEELLNGPGRERITLNGLDLGRSAALLAQSCGALAVDDRLAAHVHNITSGNPFFITQLGRFLLDHARIQIVNGNLVAVEETLSLERDFQAHGVPATLEGVVMGRLDALPAVDRETVRVASVLGGSFSRNDLSTLLGSVPDLSPLIDAGVLVAADAAAIDFRHAILRDVAYSTLSLADRRRVHGAVAHLMRAKPELAAGQLDAVLAHHLEQAGDLDSAVAHGLKAGRSLLRGNANREALAQFVHSIELLANLAPDRRAALAQIEIDIELSAGEAAQRLSLYDAAVLHKDKALAALGGAIPGGGAAALALLGEIAAQLVHRLAPWLTWGHRPDPQALRLSAEMAELVEIYFYRGESLRSLYAALRALNLAEGGGDTPQLARGFGIVGTIAGFARLSGVARSYGERALDVLSRIDDAGASWWVPLVVGVSRLSAGDLATASRLMDMTAAAAERIRDRRHWRDAIGNQSIISGLRGDWNGGLALSLQYGATAAEDRDTRYIVGAAREQAYYYLQLGRLDEAEQCLADLRTEIERGLKAEDAASRQDMHAIGAAIALARGDTTAARREVEAGYAVLRDESGSSSFPNMFWSISLLFDVFVGLAGTRREEDRAKAWALVRALDKHAASHLIGKPAALRARGLYEQKFGWTVAAGRWLERAAETARDLGMAYASEPALARGPASRLARFLPSWLRRDCSSR